jgi:hypothetical protein
MDDLKPAGRAGTGHPAVREYSLPVCAEQTRLFSAAPIIIIGSSSCSHAWQCNIRWWYHRATPADAFLLGPSGYGYVYPALLDRASQRAFATATADAAAALGMTGYIHWDWLGDFDVGLGTKRTAASIDR